MASIRDLPPVHRFLQDPTILAWVEKLGQKVVTEQVRAFLGHVRGEIQRGGSPSLDWNDLLGQFCAHLETNSGRHFREVINATGIPLHTNLGRSPLAESAARAAYLAGCRYTNLEIDLDSGLRSSRQKPLREVLCRLTGAESATVVNNCAAATILVLRAMALNREVIVSRGQLIEIGGSFRLPEIMATSGAQLREVGSTNITRIGDYEKAIGPQTAALMRVHTSNFRIRGFTQETSLEELIELGRKHSLPVIDDAGSGAIQDPASFGLAGEPLPQEAMKAGADVTLFSGDKLVGGPQAGIICGRRSWIEKIEKDPFMRAVRCDKMTLAALEETLKLHQDPALARREIPLLRMLSRSAEELRAIALGWATRLQDPRWKVEPIETHAFVGGGSLPEERLVTWVVALTSDAPGETWAKNLRGSRPAILARIEKDRLLLDPRAVFEDQVNTLVESVKQAWPAPLNR